MVKIISLPHDSLRTRSNRVAIVTDEVRAIIDSMKKATLDWEDSREHELGVALAGVQIDQLLRDVIIRDDFNDKKNRNFAVFINPEVVKYEGELVEDYEGCLSIKDIYGKVFRYSKVRIKAIDENGNPIRMKADGFLARVLQHEIDHTNGIVFIDHIKVSPQAFYKLDDNGHLEALDYELNIKDNSDLWNE